MDLVFECAGLELRSKDAGLCSKSTLVITIYRSKSSDFRFFLNKFKSLLDGLKGEIMNENSYITGDFNVSLLGKGYIKTFSLINYSRLI